MSITDEKSHLEEAEGGVDEEWPLAGSQYPKARPMGYDYGFSRSLNGRSGTAGIGKMI